jgi:teichuronic acid biosynthesis glycosyltransferase TuaC
VTTASAISAATAHPLRAIVVTNIYPTPATPTLGTFVADQVASLRDAGVLVDLVHVQRVGGGRRVYGRLAEDVSHLVESERPDVVHVMYGGVMADIVTRAVRDVPVVVSFCGTDLLGGRGTGIVHSASRRYGVYASRRAAARATGIIVKSRNLFDALPSDVDRSRVWIVPNGVDLVRFRPRDRGECRLELDWDPGRRHVLFAGSPARPEKRFRLARSAVEVLRAEGVDVDLHALVGVAPPEVATWLNASDLVLLTSAHEGSPNVVKEALACNVPVVSVDVGDIGERIAEIDGCFLAEPTAQDLAAKTAWALEYERIDARQRIQELSLERVAARVSEIYARVSERTVRPGGLERSG